MPTNCESSNMPTNQVSDCLANPSGFSVTFDGELGCSLKPWGCDPLPISFNEGVKCACTIHASRVASAAALALTAPSAPAAPMYRVELMWGREFTWVPFGPAVEDLNRCISTAKELEKSGEGGRVKKTRIVNQNGVVVWAFGRRV